MQNRAGKGLRLVSFDGGGIRSLSQLLIMRNLIQRFKYASNPDDADQEILPCDCVEMMGGSSTGGLIALMLAKLRMSVNDAIKELWKICSEVYIGTLSPSIRTNKLKNCIEDLLRRRGLPIDLKLAEDDRVAAQGCPCFVIVTLKDNLNSKVKLRTYRGRTGQFLDVTLVDAVLATCASEPAFLPISIGSELNQQELIGGAMGAANPCHELILEAQDKFKSTAHISTIISIGSGQIGVLSGAAKDSERRDVLQTMADSCERTARGIKMQIGHLAIYFRFSVEQGLQQLYGARVDDFQWLDKCTAAYLKDEEVSSCLDDCTKSLISREQVITLEQLRLSKSPRVHPQLIHSSIQDLLVSEHDEELLQELQSKDVKGGTGKGLRLVSFDGGGIRSLSQLRIMKNLIQRFEYEIGFDDDGRGLPPCKCVEMMGGTDTGGLIALMFAKLRMSVDETIEEFYHICREVYMGELSPSMRTEKLRRCIQDLLERRGLPADLRLRDDSRMREQECLCFVIATPLVNMNNKVKLRTYRSKTYRGRTEQFLDITLVDAILATCATQPAFLPVSIGPPFSQQEMVGGAMGTANLCRELVSEAQDTFMLDKIVHIPTIINLGSGHPGALSGPNKDTHWMDVLRNIVEICKRTEQGMEVQIGDFDIFSWFSADQGLPRLYGAKADDIEWLNTRTTIYIQDMEVSRRFDECVEGLISKSQVITRTQLGLSNIDTDSPLPSLDESNLSSRPIESAEDWGRSVPHLPTESVHTTDELPELERLMQQRMPLDLTGEVVIPPDMRIVKRGGFALVWKGVWQGIHVAVKVLAAEKNLRRPAPWEASMERRLNREIRVWAALSHPNIAQFLGSAVDHGSFPAMISTWYDLGTARDYLDNDENMAMGCRIRLVQDVANGLQYLHQLKIIHGDLKPTNVLIDDDHVACLCDFGLVRLDDWQGPEGMTTTSPYMGTERYKAPELFITIDNRHPRATCEGDIWALGCIALESIESKIPYERCSHSVELTKAISDGELPASRPRLSESNDLFFQHFWGILEACWAWYPENRLKVSEVVDELAQLSELDESVNV